MAEDNKSSGLFWAALLLLGGGALWTINKFMIVPAKTTPKTKKSGGTKTNTTTISEGGTQTTTVSGSSTQTPTVSINDATKDGMPYSLDLSLINYTVNPKYVPKGQTNSGKYDNKYDVFISAKGGISLFKTNSNGFKIGYLYSPKGKFLSKSTDTPIVINFTKIASINWLFKEPTPYYHVIFFTITNNYTNSISTAIVCHLELSYNGNVISTLDYDINSGGIKIKNWTDSDIQNSPDQPFSLQKIQLPKGIFNLGMTLKSKDTETFFLPFWYDDKNVSIQETHDDFGIKPNYVGSNVDINIKGNIKIAGANILINQTLSVPIDSSTNDFAFTKDIYPNYYNTGGNTLYIPDTTNLSSEDSQLIDAQNNFAILNEMEANFCTMHANDDNESMEYCLAQQQS
jgi:hypothetical protein